MRGGSEMWQNGGPMVELGPHERRLLEALQEDDSPSPMDADRIKERVLLSVSVAAAAGLVTATTVSTATGASVTAATGTAGTAALSSTALTGKAALGAVLWKALVVVGATAGLGGGVYLAMNESDTPALSHPNQESAAQERAQHRAPANDSANENEATKALTSQDAEPEKEGSLAEAAPTAALPRASKKVEGSVATDLKQEAALLQKAQAALQNGNPQGALAALAEHKTKFPRGVLSGEREAALSVAYCNAGDWTQGRARAQAFVSKNPGSPMVQRVQAACKLPRE
jgi:hypothetical protein